MRIYDAGMGDYGGENYSPNATPAMTLTKELPMSTFANVLPLALAGASVRRAGWINKFHLECVTGLFAEPFLVRTPDGKRPIAPWGPTEDDMFADDWQVDGPVEPFANGSAGVSFAAALTAAMQGARIRAVGWRDGMFVDRVDGSEMLRITVAAGAPVKLWRPQPQDLTAEWTVTMQSER